MKDAIIDLWETITGERARREKEIARVNEYYQRRDKELQKKNRQMSAQEKYKELHDKMFEMALRYGTDSPEAQEARERIRLFEEGIFD